MGADRRPGTSATKPFNVCARARQLRAAPSETQYCQMIISTCALPSAFATLTSPANKTPESALEPEQATGPKAPANDGGCRCQHSATSSRAMSKIDAAIRPERDALGSWPRRVPVQQCSRPSAGAAQICAPIWGPCAGSNAFRPERDSSTGCAQLSSFLVLRQWRFKLGSIHGDRQSGSRREHCALSIRPD